MVVLNSSSNWNILEAFQTYRHRRTHLIVLHAMAPWYSGSVAQAAALCQSSPTLTALPAWVETCWPRPTPLFHRENRPRDGKWLYKDAQHVMGRLKARTPFFWVPALNLSSNTHIPQSPIHSPWDSAFPRELIKNTDSQNFLRLTLSESS